MLVMRGEISPSIPIWGSDCVDLSSFLPLLISSFFLVKAEVGATGAEAFDATYAGLATYRGGVAWDSRGVVIR